MRLFHLVADGLTAIDAAAAEAGNEGFHFHKPGHRLDVRDHSLRRSAGKAVQGTDVGASYVDPKKQKPSLGEGLLDGIRAPISAMLSGHNQNAQL